MKKFRERNPLGVAAVAAAILVIAALIALNISRLPLISHQRTYQADFATAVGLKNGDVVTIAGVRVGAITALSLHGDVARVSFTVNGGPRIGVDSEVHAKVLNPVGVEYIQIEPRGPGHLDQPVPVTRTTVAGTLVGDLNQLTRQTQQTNIPQLVKALGVLGQTLSAGSPAETKAAIDGVAHLSSIFAARQGEISDLIDQANQLTA
ncbi:MAG: MlaD family protein, partial [Acidimicrobiales bacterium]